MKKIFLALLSSCVLHSSVQAADKIRIGFDGLIAAYISLPLGQKRGFLQEEGLQGELIRMSSTVGLATLVTGEIDYYTAIRRCLMLCIAERSTIEYKRHEDCQFS
jgi:ABC-type nitrate/sulfonate/bicarbonate transport system substrate-binding protein